MSCAQTACAGTCADSCGGYVYPDAKCAECAAKHCCPPAAICSGDSDCLGLSFCEQKCATHDSTCRGQCQRRHAPGALAARELTECLASSCQAACHYRADPWGCLDDAEPPVPSGELELEIFRWEIGKNFGEFEPMEGVDARLCAAEDTVCDPATAIDAGTSDADGKVTLNFGAGTAAYVLVDHPDPAFVDAILPPRSAPVAMVTWQDEDLYFSTLIGPRNPVLGALFPNATDCDGAPAAGISFELEPVDPAAVAIYGGLGALPGTTTGSKGGGAFLNVTPGKYVLRAIRRDPEECIRESTVIVRAGTNSFVGLVPRRCASWDGPGSVAGGR
jgi:hypothetical protein